MRVVGLGFALCGLLWSAGAFAYCRTTTCDPTDASQHCQLDERTQCVVSGTPLRWLSGCITVNVQHDAAPLAHISIEDAEASVTRAFDSWLSADCNGARPSLEVKLGEPVTCDASEYSKVHHNANIVIFREGVWPYEGGEDALGITRLRYDLEDAPGELWDADIEINAVTEPLSVIEPKRDEVDLDSLLTHEVGHLLGFGHTLDVASTMIAGYTAGSVALRTPSADDLSGMCAIYPPDRQVTKTSCEPRHGFSELCASEQPPYVPPDDETIEPKRKSGGCAMAPGPGSSECGFIGLLGLAALKRIARKRDA
jgi:hypothetical protein